ncbi:protein SLOW WALKER 1 [Ricinus communis]|uniref:U3 small nucleolar RNA-associated protein, putative n=1 Tax=Ricinus communis TaxID=3988 RepID=B9SE89_RICCO|nr:protein SLOW WALKER 1 [Ricinus communis]EEF38048.1 U3 small nucleolar RNA-associated protein, putative [Ricinus communis]|eukprot:XP_002524308.1 protein SLOW WALKER 1 [Ricinus communis]
MENQNSIFPIKPKLKPKSRTPSKSPESKYWSSFKSTQIPNLISSIPSIAYSPIPSSHLFAAANSASLTLFSSQTFAPTSSISSFSDVVSSCSFRSDGSLIAASDLSGLVQVFDVKSRNPLRRLKSHARPVRFVKYPFLDKLHLVSGGDDAIVKYWDVASETVVLDLLGHKDYVRCGDCSPIDGEVFVTGSYDHCVKLWDVRVESKRSVLEMNHGKPIEDVMFLPSGGMLVTAGGNSVKIWDLIGGGKMVHSVESHNKTVMSVCVGKIMEDEGMQYRIMSVGLDGYMKVFDYAKMKITHSMRFPAPLMSIGVSPDCMSRAIGTSNGIIFGGRRKVKENEEQGGRGFGDFMGLGSIGEPQRRVLRPTNFRYFHRSQGEKPNEGDYLILRPKKVKLAEHDKLLKKFRHKEAFVSVLSGKNPEYVVAVMEELVARRKLIKCVSNLDEEELGLLLGFLHKYSTMPRHSGLLMGLTRKVLDMRADDIKASDALKGHIRNLKRSVEEEIRIHHALQEIQGIISPLLRIAGRR